MRCFTRDAGISQENSDSLASKCRLRITSGWPTNQELRILGQDHDTTTRDYAVAPHSCDRFFGTVMANFELACPSLLNPCSDTSEMGHMLLLRSKEEHHVSCAE
jgi:hypothetical protein